MAALTSIDSIHIKLRMTEVVIPLMIISIVIIYLLNWNLEALFINLGFMFSIIVSFAITSAHYGIIFDDLEIVRRKKAPVKLSAGITLAGTSHILKMFGDDLGDSMMLIIAVFMLVGGILIASAWSDYPELKDLRWIMQLERLFIIKKGAFLPIIDHSFQTEGQKEPIGSEEGKKESPEGERASMDATLAGGAFGGIISLLKEILATNSDIKKIEHEDKSILFSHGNEIIGVLIVDEYHYEQAYHLNEFVLEFEREYRKGLEDWSGDISQFGNAKRMIDSTFQ